MEDPAPAGQRVPSPVAPLGSEIAAAAKSLAESSAALAPPTGEQGADLSLFEEGESGRILQLFQSLHPAEAAGDTDVPPPPAGTPGPPPPPDAPSAPAPSEPPPPEHATAALPPEASSSAAAPSSGSLTKDAQETVPFTQAPSSAAAPLPEAAQPGSANPDEDEVDQADIEAVAAAMAASGWNLEDLGDLEDEEEVGKGDIPAPTQEQVSNTNTPLPSDMPMAAAPVAAPVVPPPSAPSHETGGTIPASEEQGEEEASHAALLALLSAATAVPSPNDTATATDSAHGTPSRDVGPTGSVGQLPASRPITNPALTAAWSQSPGPSSRPMPPPEVKKRRGRPPKQPPLDSTQFITTPEGQLIGESTFTAAGLHFESQSPIPASAMDDWSQAEPHRTAQGDVICPFPGCGKFFPKNRAYNLKAHLRCHGPFRPYKCLRCEMAFTRKHDLERHARKHTGDKPYLCEVCYASFQRSDALRHHWRSERACGLKIAEMAQDGTLGQHAHDLLNGGHGGDESEDEPAPIPAPPPPPAFPLSAPFPSAPPIPMMPPQPVKRKRGRPRKNPLPPAPAATPANPWSMMGSFSGAGMPPMFPYNPYGFSPFMPFMSPYGYGMMGGRPLVPPPVLPASAPRGARSSSSGSESGSESESDSGATSAAPARTEDSGLGDALRQLQRLQDQLDREEAGKRDKGKAVSPPSAPIPAEVSGRHSVLPPPNTDPSTTETPAVPPPPDASSSAAHSASGQVDPQRTAPRRTDEAAPRPVSEPPATAPADSSVPGAPTGSTLVSKDTHSSDAPPNPAEEEEEEPEDLAAAAVMWTAALADLAKDGAGLGHQDGEAGDAAKASPHTGEEPSAPPPPATAAAEAIRTAPEPHAPEPHAPEPHAPEPHAPEPHAPEPHAPEPHAPEPHAPEPHAPEPHAPELPAPAHAPEPPAPVTDMQTTDSAQRDDDVEDTDLAGLSEEDLALLYAAAQEAAAESLDVTEDSQPDPAASTKRPAELGSLSDVASSKRLRVG